MAVVGVSIGFSFLLALMLGPLLGQWQGLSGLFWITACLAGVALLVVWLTVPTATRVLASVEILPARSQINTVLFNRQLQGLNLGIFVLHMTLTALFIAVPVGLRDTLRSGFSESLAVLCASLGVFGARHGAVTHLWDATAQNICCIPSRNSTAARRTADPDHRDGSDCISHQRRLVVLCGL